MNELTGTTPLQTLTAEINSLGWKASLSRQYWIWGAESFPANEHTRQRKECVLVTASKETTQGGQPGSHLPW